MSVAIQVILFLVTHLPEILTAVKAVLSFIKAHKDNPKLSAWTSEFARLASEAREKKDPKPLEDFLARIRNEVAG